MTTTAAPRATMSHYVPPHQRNRAQKAQPAPMEGATEPHCEPSKGRPRELVLPADTSGPSTRTKPSHTRQDSPLESVHAANMDTKESISAKIEHLARELSSTSPEHDAGAWGTAPNCPRMAAVKSKPQDSRVNSAPQASAPRQGKGGRGKAWDHSDQNGNGASGRKPRTSRDKEPMRQTRKLATEQWARPKNARRKQDRDSNAWGSPDEDDDNAPLQAWEDPEAAVANMLQWDGTMLPPPVDGPTPYRGRHLLQPMVNKWLTAVCAAFPDGIPVIETGPASKFTTDSKANDAHLGILGDVAPRYWVPELVAEYHELDALQKYWDECFRYYIKELDLKAQPFWCNWVDETPLQHCLEMPVSKMDPNDECYGRYIKDQGSQKAADALLARKSKRRKRFEAARAAERAARASLPVIQPPPNRYAPDLDLLVRTFDINSDSDVKQVTAIYNDYVQHSVFVQEREEIPSEQMHDRLGTILDNRLPVLVAVERQKPSEHGSSHQPRSTDKIVGFAYVDEIGPRRTMNEFSSDLEIYVSPSHLTRGVGKNLLDRVLFCLDALYQSKGACAWDGGDEWHHGGGRRLIRNVFCHMPYASDDQARLAWVGGFLKRFNFERVGGLPDMGVKLDQNVSVAIFCYKTGTNIDPRNPYG